MKHTERELINFIKRAHTVEQFETAAQWFQNHITDPDELLFYMNILCYEAEKIHLPNTDPTGYITIENDPSIDLTLLYNQTCAF